MQIMCKFLKHCERFKGTGVKTLVTEKKSEFVDSNLESHLRKSKIEHIKTEPNQKKPVIDYYVRSIQIMLKLLMADAEGISTNVDILIQKIYLSDHFFFFE